MIRFVCLGLLLLASVSLATSQESWLERTEAASSLFDNRGYSNDASISVDGNVSVSRSNGNVQYVYPLSSFTVNEVPISFSLSYNQNASYTAFRRYDAEDNKETWQQMKANRPAWIFGVNGFAVQALEYAPRNVLRPELRVDPTSKMESNFSDKDIVWLLDGYEFCNRMKPLQRVQTDTNTPLTDVIRLLRADGSVMELYRCEKPLPWSPTRTREHLISGVYVTAEANTSAYAVVKLQRGRMSGNYVLAIAAWCRIHRNGLIVTTGEDVPPEFVPRTVEYFPGDGSSYTFGEVMTPYGLEPMIGKQNVSGNSGNPNDGSFSGWADAAPTIFYLESINYNTVPLIEFDYDNHDPLKPQKVGYRGRSQLIGFDGHSLRWGAKSVTIEALGKTTEVQFDDCLYGGSVDEAFRLAKLTPSMSRDAAWDAVSEYFSWTGLVTEIIDPALRTTRFKYADYSRIYSNAEFPLIVVDDKANCESPGCPHLLDHHTDLKIDVKRLTWIRDPLAQYALEYNNPTSMDNGSGPMFDFIKLKYDWINKTDTDGFIRKIETSVVTAYFRPLVDPLHTSVANKLTKLDRLARLGTGSMAEGTPRELWIEDYQRNRTFSNGQYPYQSKTTLTRTTFRPDGSSMTSISDETSARYHRNLSYFNMADGTKDKTIYSTEQVLATTTAEGVTEVLATLFDFDEASSWQGNYHLPFSTKSSTRPHRESPESEKTRIQTDFLYEFDTLRIDYDGFQLADFNSSFGNPLRKKTATSSVYQENLGVVYGIPILVPFRKQTDEFQNFKSIVVTSSVANRDKFATQQAFLSYWRNETNWTNEEADRQFSNTTTSSPWYVPRSGDEPTTLVQIAPPVFGLLHSSTIEDPTQHARIESRVSHQYNQTPMANAPQMSPAYGTPIGSALLSRDLLRSRTLEFTRVEDEADYPIRSLTASSTNSLGAVINFGYEGRGNPSWLTNKKFVGASKITNAGAAPTGILPAGKTIATDIELSGMSAKYYEKPSHTETIVRKPIGSSSANVALRSATAYTYFGLPSATVDHNGYLSMFEYDMLGRLNVAWLANDFAAESETLLWPVNDILENRRVYNVWGSTVKGDCKYSQLTCYVNCDAPVPVSFIGRPLGWGGVGVGWQVGNYAGTPAQCPCESGQGVLASGSKEADKPQSTTPGDPTLVVYESFTREYVHSSFVVPISEHKSVTSAKLRLSLASLQYTTGCLPLHIKVSIAGQTASDSHILYERDVEDPYLICPPSHVDPNGYPQTLSIQPVSGYLSDIEVDLSSSLAYLTSDPNNGIPVAKFVHVEITVNDDESIGLVTFSRIDLIFNGSFAKVGSPRKDFTLAFKHDDQDRHVVSTLAKVDDRSQAFDLSHYPSGSTNLHSQYSRHAKSLVTLTTDDLVQKVQRNFGPNATTLLNSSALPSPTTTSTTFYSGASVPVTVTNERGHTAMALHDALGRPTSTDHGNVFQKWAEIESNNPIETSSLGPRSETSYSVETPTEFSIPASRAPSFNGICSREVLAKRRVDVSTDYEKTAVFYDARNRKRLVVTAYDEATFASYINNQAIVRADLNLATWYDYDALDRVIKITNPKNQEITYTYDDFGNVASTTQVDIGTVSYAYDRLGNLRFSQTLEQSLSNALTFRQYDDLNRPTIIGEARVVPPPHTVGGATPLLTALNPDVLHAPGQITLSVNNTILAAPTVLVPRIYTPLLNPFAPPGQPGPLLWNGGVPCTPLIAAGSSDRFNPSFPATIGNILTHLTGFYTRPTTVAPNEGFESVSAFPQFVLQAIWYDEMPPQSGAIFGGAPPTSVWNGLAPRNEVRNLKGRPSVVAYRTHGGQPFHYVVRSYDERGRVEVQLRLTENIGFDGVYYRYNSMNKITAIHVVDATGQHATFYGYDENGRVSKVWTMRNNQGYGLTMTPVRPALLSLHTTTTPPADMKITYDAADAVASVTYPTAGVSTAYTYNELGSLMRSTTTTSTSPSATLFEQRLSYWPNGLIYEQWTNTDGVQNVDVYDYDLANRLTKWERNQARWTEGGSKYYMYDRIGNRLSESITGDGVGVYPTLYTLGLLGTLSQPNTLRAVTGPVNSFTDAMTYDADGAMLTRQRDRTTDGMRTQRLEAYSYDAFNLVERFTLKHDATMVAGGEGCLPDASTKPMDDWRYRFGPLQEREQKRQYATSNNIALDGLAWTYTLLGADAKQLATYNGVQGNFCGQAANTVWMWPVEFNSYGPAQSRIITRSNGAREYVISDHLGSSRLTLNNTGEILQRTDYQPFGIEINEAGTGSRTSYIGREKDRESDLGFYGVRMYEPEYGRFMSVDPLWGKYAGMQPYQYALNQPLTIIDFSGFDSTQRSKAVEKAQAYIESGSTYVMGRKGDPGKPVDCSGLVSACVKAGGERDPNKGSKPSGVLNIESNIQSVSIGDAQAGNIITFRNEQGGSYPYHTGIIEKVTRDDEGNVKSFDIIHSSSSANGPNRRTIDPHSDNALGRSIRVEGVYKWDTKPDVNQSSTSAPSNSPLLERGVDPR